MRLSYYEANADKKTTIVFLHGAGVGPWMWKKQFEYFSRYRIIAPELPGHGDSARILPCTISNCADAVQELLTYILGNQRCVLVGHSLGAQVALRLISENTPRIDLAVIISALVHPTPLLYNILIKPFIGLTVNQLRKDSMLNAQTKQFKFPDGEMEKSFKESIRSITEPVMSDIYRENQLFRLPTNLSAAKIPVLSLAGAKEMGKMRRSTMTISQSFPGTGRGYLIPRGDHTCPWTEYDIVNRSIEAWIDGTALPINLKKTFEP
jgi:pimeloyl-ACP methyl ester carboxylesterase